LRFFTLFKGLFFFNFDFNAAAGLSGGYAKKTVLINTTLSAKVGQTHELVLTSERSKVCVLGAYYKR
jgi:hypothetical protein